MSTTRTSPANSAPGSSTAPVFAAPNATVRSARTATPSTAALVPSTPLGMSTATIGTSAAFSPSIASAHSSSGSPRNPVPKIASTATSARSSSRPSVAGSNRRTRTPVSARRRRLAAAGSRDPAGSCSTTTTTRIPHRARCRAVTNPSPPLFPLPHTTTARRPYEPPVRSAQALATAQPARSMRSSAATPRACVARSSSTASCGERTGFIRRSPRSRTRPRSSARG